MTEVEKTYHRNPLWQGCITRPVTIVIGGQFGSEGKGEIVAAAVSESAKFNKETYAIRVGGPQAGHCVTRPGGVKFPMCQIPCGFHEPSCTMITGPGSEVSPAKLMEEVKMLTDAGYDLRGRLFIDGRATILWPKYADAEKEKGLTGRLGSTSKGIGQCRADRIMRMADVASDCEIAAEIIPAGKQWGNKERIGIRINDDWNRAAIIETAQGYALSLHLSGFYPFCTSTDITPGRALSDAGISSRTPHRVIMVVRTFPIRVAGNSGPMRFETTWEDVYRISNGRSPLEGEQTTVTKKTRRVGTFDWQMLADASQMIKPDGVIISFMDYSYPEMADSVDWEKDVMTNGMAMQFISDVEATSDSTVIGVATGPGKIAMRPNFYLGPYGHGMRRS